MPPDQNAQAAILGILQGLSEFLPISSSAHLILLPWLLGWKPMGLAFDVVIHGGTMGGVLIYFWPEWRELLGEWRSWLAGNFHNSRLSTMLLVGTVPAVVAGLTLADHIEEYARAPLITVFTLAGFGLLLGWADRTAGQGRHLRALSLREVLLIGVAQATALVPGVSRSGITITAGLLLGLRREEAARFSFLLSAPVIVLGVLHGLLSFFSAPPEKGVAVLGLPALLVGVVTAFVVGYLCIKYFLKYVQRRSYIVFVVYRLVLAAVILVVSFW